MPLDAFEARLTFIELLRRLNASVQSATKCAQFALRYQDLSEDLYSCILEELDKVSLVTRQRDHDEHAIAAESSRSKC
jgi:CTD kinase subunit gamma